MGKKRQGPRLSTRVNVADVGGNSGGAGNIVEGEAGDKGIQLHEEGEGLADPSGGPQNGDLPLRRWLGGVASSNYASRWGRRGGSGPLPQGIPGGSDQGSSHLPTLRSSFATTQVLRGSISVGGRTLQYSTGRGSCPFILPGRDLPPRWVARCYGVIAGERPVISVLVPHS